MKKIFAASYRNPRWKYIAIVSSVLLGFVFLVSAFAKAWEADIFALSLLQYGPKWLGGLAPVVITCEVVLGLCLLMQIRPKWTALATDIFLIGVSAIFAYGVLTKGILSCGCFGQLDRLYTPKPWLTFVRNAVFALLTVPILLAETKQEKHLSRKLMVMLPIVAAVCFISGLAMKRSFTLPRFAKADEDMKKTQMMAKLQDLYPFRADSTYFVYLFSFSCPYCQNSFANVQQYQQFGIVDKVLGVAVEDEELQKRFNRIYQPEIEIITIPHDSMSQITHSLPIAVLIKGDTIDDILSGIITSPGIFVE